MTENEIRFDAGFIVFRKLPLWKRVKLSKKCVSSYNNLPPELRAAVTDSIKGKKVNRYEALAIASIGKDLSIEQCKHLIEEKGERLQSAAV